MPACGIIINSALFYVHEMQPDFNTTSSHWPGLSQNWFYPPLTSPPYFSMPGLHPDSVRNSSRFSEQMIQDSLGDMTSATRSPRLSPCGLSPSYPASNYLPTRGNSYYSRSPVRQEVLPSGTSPYRLAEHGPVNTEYFSFNQMLERETNSSTEG